MDHPSLKMSLFVEHGFSRERDSKHYFKFHMKKAMLPIYGMMPVLLGFQGRIADLEATELSR
jgi:hypothetical protein